MYCDHCGSPISENNKFCKNCGKPVNVAPPVPAPEEPKKKPLCPYCGTPFEEGEVFCSHCGNKLQGAPVMQPPVTPAVPVQAPPQPAPAAPVPPVVPPNPAPAPQPVMRPQTQPVMQHAQRPVQPVAKPQKAKMSKGKLAVLIAIPILILAIGVGAYFFLTEQKKQDSYNVALELMEDRKYDEAQEKFEALGNYKDAPEHAKALLEKKETFQKAQDLLKENRFDEAEALFASLKDYRDADTYTGDEMAYLKACYLLEGARRADQNALAAVGIDPKGTYEEGKVEQILYNSALEIFKNLDGYKDAQDYVMDCEMGLLDLYIAKGDEEAFLKKLNALMEEAAISPELYEDLQNQFYRENANAERLFRDNLLASLREARELMEVGGYDVSEFIDMQLQYLEPVYEYPFEDADMEVLFYDYVDLLYRHYDMLWYEADAVFVDDYAGWYYLRSEACDYLIILQEVCGFFDEDMELLEFYKGRGEFYLARAVLEESMDNQLVGVAATYSEEADAYFLTYENDTRYSFTLLLLLEFYDGNTFISDSGWYEVEIPAWETVSIPILFDLESDWDTWYINWDFENVFADGKEIQ